MWRFSSQQSRMLRSENSQQREFSVNRKPLVAEGFRRFPKANGYLGVSPLLHEAMLTTEDRWFYYHCGINPVSMVTALYDNVKSGEVVRGGSTITMQLARLMEPKARTSQTN